MNLESFYCVEKVFNYLRKHLLNNVVLKPLKYEHVFFVIQTFIKQSQNYYKF
jgi:hypothetical protein